MENHSILGEMLASLLIWGFLALVLYALARIVVAFSALWLIPLARAFDFIPAVRRWIEKRSA